MRKHFNKIIIGIFMLTASLVVSQNAMALDTTLHVGGYTWSEKLGRGLLNMVSSPVEIARSISVTSHTENPGYGWTIGLLQGIGRFGVRLGAGLVETVTFPFEFPKEGRAPLLTPEYPWQKWDADYATNKV